VLLVAVVALFTNVPAWAAMVLVAALAGAGLLRGRA
jgi:hypothetical protein